MVRVVRRPPRLGVVDPELRLRVLDEEAREASEALGVGDARGMVRPVRAEEHVPRVRAREQRVAPVLLVPMARDVDLPRVRGERYAAHPSARLATLDFGRSLPTPLT